MSERTLIFHRTSLPDDTVLLQPADPISGHGHMTVTAVQRNDDGAIIGSYIREFDPWPITGYQFGLGTETGQTNYRHLQLTVWCGQLQETIELARGGEITVAAVSVNEDGHRTQPLQYRVPFDGLEAITIGQYKLKPAGRNHAVLGLIVGKTQVYDSNGEPLGWTPVYDTIAVPETDRLAV